MWPTAGCLTASCDILGLSRLFSAVIHVKVMAIGQAENPFAFLKFRAFAYDVYLMRLAIDLKIVSISRRLIY